jgi:HAD superfamily, subfamily IIIB (Acid phosphatase)
MAASATDAITAPTPPAREQPLALGHPGMARPYSGAGPSSSIAPMRSPSLAARLVQLAVVALAVVGVASATGAVGASKPLAYPSTAGPDTFGVRPTATGLPQVGEKGTIGAKEFSQSLAAYHDSGAYARDLRTVVGAARAYVDGRLAKASFTRTCTTTYRRVKHSRLYGKVRRCVRVRTSPALTGKAAVVLDIDETALSNYAGIVKGDFGTTGSVGPIVNGTGTAIAPTLALYRDARARGVAVFFVTGRPSVFQKVTVANLKKAGYTKGWTGLAMKPTAAKTAAFKSAQRAAIQKRGYDIVANLGDQESDLDGGHADRAFKLPNPFYFVAD